jgi:hypothetical protein
MIVVTHRPGRSGWEFDSDVGLDGATRTLEASMECAEHAARHYLSRQQGYEVLQDDARYQVEHVVLSDGSSAPPRRRAKSGQWVGAADPVMRRGVPQDGRGYADPAEAKE